MQGINLYGAICRISFVGVLTSKLKQSQVKLYSMSKRAGNNLIKINMNQFCQIIIPTRYIMDKST